MSKGAETSGFLLQNKHSLGVERVEGRVCGEMTPMSAKLKETN